MNTKPALAHPHAAVPVVAAALAALIGLGTLSALTGLFQRDGAPFEQLVGAEQACADRSFVSEREACVRLFIAATRVQNFASR
jgi:hypothetical protein